MAENKSIHFKYDPETGSIELDAPTEEFEKAAKNAQSLVEALAKHADSIRSAQSSASAAQSSVVAENKPISAQDNTTRRSARPGSSTGRLGRIGSFEPVKFPLKEDQERALMDFYAEKKPKEQAEKVAVAMNKGEELIGRKSFNYNEIYTLMRLSGERELPKALDVVIGRMVTDNWANRERDGVSLKFPARDYVEQNLPRKG